MIAVRRIDVWRVAVGVAGAASIASLLAWVVLAPLGQGAGVRVAVGVAGLVAAALAGSLWRLSPGVLGWDGSGWSFAALGPPPSAPLAGELEASLDLGSFVLLRFISRTLSGRRSVRWIPVERRGHEREWHSFRCAVYSPRPVAGMVGDADSAPL